ncbi:hypothetical protein OUZ56_024886 [Daphnia magna]|uniref:Uncharacterized protein n=1 Tax=Daphnia magna TaxID=35525 RepID=A0ABQ9ZI96_9CRUS|nr:hypothetical protein OUZ56_024886 [Daphnia magna]
MLAVGVLVLVCGCMTGYTTSALFLSSSSVHRVSGTVYEDTNALFAAPKNGTLTFNENKRHLEVVLRAVSVHGTVSTVLKRMY